jgi:hypothetical protein
MKFFVGLHQPSVRGSSTQFKIMELRDGGKWWHMGWDIPQYDMSSYEILAPVAPYTGGKND